MLLWFLSLAAQIVAQSYPAHCRITTTLNVRQGPGTGYPKIGKLYPNDYIVVESVTRNGSREWGIVNYRNQTGYVAMQYTMYMKAIPSEQTPQASSLSDNIKNFSFSDFLGRAWTILKYVLIGLIILIIIAFWKNLVEIAIFIGLFMGAGALLFWMLFDNASMGATFGFWFSIFIGVRKFMELIGAKYANVFDYIYRLVSFPFWFLNRLQLILTGPWRYLFKYIHVGDTSRNILRPLFYGIQLLLYIITTPLRLVNAIIYNIFIYGLTELYDLTCEVFLPNNPEEGYGSFWRWIVWFPVRLVKYPIFHGSLVLIEGAIWTVIDIFIPTITMYHGTNLDAAQTIVGSSNRNTSLWGNWLAGTIKASDSDNGWGGLGVYFSPSRQVVSWYAARAGGECVFIACRVSLGKILNYALAPIYVENNLGNNQRHSVLNSYADKNGYTTAEWWNGAYWEYCMFDWQNRYNHPWRIRPIYVFNLKTGFAQHIDGGFRHWLFSKSVLDDINSSIPFMIMVVVAIIVVIWFACYGWQYLWNEYLWYYF